VFIVPALTLISKNWLLDALSYFEQSKATPLVRPQLSIKWGDELAPVITEQISAMDPLYSIFEPFYSGIVGATNASFLQALEEVPAETPNEFWLSQGAYWLDQKCHIIPNTAVFTRSLDATADSSRSGLPIFSISNAKNAKISAPISKAQQGVPVTRTRPNSSVIARKLAKGILRRLRLLELAKTILVSPSATNKQTTHSNLPDWLIDEWRELHRIDNRIFPNRYLAEHATITDSPSNESQLSAYLYTKIAQSLSKDSYDYIFFAPWLIRGGADKYTIDYANTIAKLRPELNILVVTTLNRPSEWSTKLHKSVDFCDFGNLTENSPIGVQYILLELLMLQSLAKTMHIINSELAYDFVKSHKLWLQQHSVQIAATSFSQETNEVGRLLGYSHTHMPEIYDSLSIITSDNQAVLTMWQKDYGFDPARLALHHLTHTASDDNSTHIKKSTQDKTFRVLWASRLSPEKMPAIVNEIGRLLQNDDVRIDMYGTGSEYFDVSFLHDSPPNVCYKGGFDGMDTLRLHDYDAFLYTSLFDGMPNTLLEIGLAGLPIVTSAVGGIPELIKSGETGILIDDVLDAGLYASALRKLKDSPEVRTDLAHNLRNTIAKDYSVEQFESSVDNMLKRLNY